MLTFARIAVLAQDGPTWPRTSSQSPSCTMSQKKGALFYCCFFCEQDHSLQLFTLMCFCRSFPPHGVWGYLGECFCGREELRPRPNGSIGVGASGQFCTIFQARSYAGTWVLPYDDITDFFELAEVVTLCSRFPFVSLLRTTIRVDQRLYFDSCQRAGL